MEAWPTLTGKKKTNLKEKTVLQNQAKRKSKFKRGGDDRRGGNGDLPAIAGGGIILSKPFRAPVLGGWSNPGTVRQKRGSRMDRRRGDGKKGKRFSYEREKTA